MRFRTHNGHQASERRPSRDDHKGLLSSRGTIRAYVHRISAVLHRKPSCCDRCYAQLHNLSIVRTYRDEGESGLTSKNRLG